MRACGGHALERARRPLCADTCSESADSLDGWMDGRAWVSRWSCVDGVKEPSSHGCVRVKEKRGLMLRMHVCYPPSKSKTR